MFAAQNERPVRGRGGRSHAGRARAHQTVAKHERTVRCVIVEAVIRGRVERGCVWLLFTPFLAHLLRLMLVLVVMFARVRIHSVSVVSFSAEAIKCHSYLLLLYWHIYLHFIDFSSFILNKNSDLNKNGFLFVFSFFFFSLSKNTFSNI